jgi:hypothetical protein
MSSTTKERHMSGCVTELVLLRHVVTLQRGRTTSVFYENFSLQLRHADEYPKDDRRQYNETNVMHFSFSLLRIKGLYMFRALLAHPQEGYTNGIWYVACVQCQLQCCGMVAVRRSLTSV